MYHVPPLYLLPLASSHALLFTDTYSFKREMYLLLEFVISLY